MIEISDKSKCCGCTACIEKCPKNCIEQIEDEEGFLYPKVIKDKCVNCKICEKVCPIIKTNIPKEPIKIYAAINTKTETRLKSSSGGIFYLIAEYVIKKRGIVFGAKFNDKWEVVHDYTDNINGIQAFLGSKYLQSNINNCYKKVELFLKNQQIVLFSGTPCQIAGLNNYLQKYYDNLITVDILCHGVPSPKIWKKYLSEIQDINKIKSIEFRNKDLGWNNYSLKIISNKTYTNPHSKDPFLKGMLNSLYIRPSCHHCQFRNQKSNSCISLGDYWGIENTDSRFADNKGTSMVLINNEKGIKIWQKISNHVKFSERNYHNATETCSMLVKPCPSNKLRNVFWERSKKKNISKTINSILLNRFSFKTYVKELLTMRQKTIIDYPGQTCNRLWSYIDTVAWAIIYNKKVNILYWDTSIKYFDALRNCKNVSFPFYNKRIINLIGEKKYQLLIKKICNNKFSHLFYKSSFSKPLGIMNGWEYRSSFKYYPTIINQIKEVFSPNSDIKNYIDKVITNYKNNGYFIVGVHIRRGDYKTWENGKYYFEYKEYKDFMKQIEALYPKEKICFLITTNEPYPNNYFNEFCICQYDSKTAIHDLYALSKCDRIIGPLSTFSRWASFYGDVPLYFIERGKIIKENDFSPIIDFYHFENGNEIPNLTDKK